MNLRRSSIRVSVALLTLEAAGPAYAGEAYRDPPANIAKILDAPSTPFSSVSPDKATMLLLERSSMPSIADMARPMLRLAGRRIDPATSGSHGPRWVQGISVVRLFDGRTIDLDLPEGGSPSFPQWSADGGQFAFTLTFSDGIELWLGDATDGSARRLTDRSVNGMGPSPVWMPDMRSILVAMIPEGRGDAPTKSVVPSGPVIQENLGGKPAPVRTYQDLLSDPHDEALFEHFFTSQMTLVDAGSGAARAIGTPGIFVEADPAPTGEYILVERIRAPYSYLVPVWRFGLDVEIWNPSGDVVTTLAELPLAERVPIQGVITGPRGHSWRDTEGTAEIHWVEALDGGDPNTEAEFRDRVMALEAPFDDNPTEIAQLEDRFAGMQFFERSSMAIVSEYDRDERWVRTWLFALGDDSVEPRVMIDRSIQDRYADPGDPITTMNSAGREVILLEDGHAFMEGRGASPEGDRPFIDRWSLDTLAAERLWRAEGECFEQVIDIASRDASTIVTRYETPTTPPNFYKTTLASGDRAALTQFEHPAPELLGIKKELVKYERADGVELSATMYLPAGYDGRERLPLVVWAYPREFNSARTASQVSGSPHRFTMMGGASQLFFLLQGYAVMNGATMPVVGPDPETVNDTFIDQLVMSADAAIAKAVEMGVADPERVGVGGHSYGAFMTANLLAHSDLFRAGIARSGAYNRTLTPFGFQAERRPLWQAKDVYFEISPFMHANKINEPMLMIHGQEDNNSGTFPMQSERMYHAVKGHGGITRLVMLPNESHGYRARESAGHVLAEMLEWFDRYVKYAEPRSEERLD